MTEPLVCCVMLTRDRPAMAARAVAAFRAQTYQNKMLVICDTGVHAFVTRSGAFDRIFEYGGTPGLTIGATRNEIAGWICEGPHSLPEILIHWDDDDVSHPARITEQVDLLQAPCPWGTQDLSTGGASMMLPEIVAYHSLLFVDERDGDAVWRYNGYPGYAIGTSLCYWRRTWEARPFADQNIGEDTVFCKDRRVVSVDGSGDPPMLVARMHHGMTSVRNMERFRNGEDHVYTRIFGPRAEQAREMLR